MYAIQIIGSRTLLQTNLAWRKLEPGHDVLCNLIFFSESKLISSSQKIPIPLCFVFQSTRICQTWRNILQKLVNACIKHVPHINNTNFTWTDDVWCNQSAVPIKKKTISVHVQK